MKTPVAERKVKIHVSLTHSLYQQLRRFADAERRSWSNALEILLSKALNGRK